MDRTFFSLFTGGDNTTDWNLRERGREEKKEKTEMVNERSLHSKLDSVHLTKRTQRGILAESYKRGSITTRKDGGRPYRRILSLKTRTAQKCIQELKTCNRTNLTQIQMDPTYHIDFWKQDSLNWSYSFDNDVRINQRNFFSKKLRNRLLFPEDS